MRRCLPVAGLLCWPGLDTRIGLRTMLVSRFVSPWMQEVAAEVFPVLPMAVEAKVWTWGKSEPPPEPRRSAMASQRCAETYPKHPGNCAKHTKPIEHHPEFRPHLEDLDASAAAAPSGRAPLAWPHGWPR